MVFESVCRKSSVDPGLGTAKEHTQGAIIVAQKVSPRAVGGSRKRGRRLLKDGRETCVVFCMQVIVDEVSMERGRERDYNDRRFVLDHANIRSLQEVYSQVLGFHLYRLSTII